MENNHYKLCTKCKKNIPTSNIKIHELQCNPKDENIDKKNNRKFI